MSAPVDGPGRRRRRPQGGLEQRRAQRARAAAPGQAGAGDGERDPQAGGRVLRPGERAPKMRFRLVRELACDLDRPVPVAVACRVLEVSASGYYEWLSRPASARDVADAHLLDTMIAIHTGSRGTYGARRVHAELRLGRAVDVGRRRVERLMRLHGLAGIHRRRFRPGRPAPARTGCGSPTSPSTAPARAGSIPRSCWTCSPAASWAGPSRTTCAPSWSWTPWTWLAGGASPPRAPPSCTPTGPPSTRPGCLGTGYAKPACSGRWARSDRPTTTP